VAAALAGSGVVVTTGPADIDVVVLAEAVKPEDRALVTATRPAVFVLNKADLTGSGPGGPLALAHRRAADCRALTGIATVPMVGLLATARLDDELVSALAALVHEPADLSSTDDFVDCAHSLSVTVRRRLLDILDRFGIAHAVLAVASGTTPDALTAHLWSLSLVDRTVAQIDAAAAPLRYRRVQAAITELHRLAALSRDEPLAQFLSSDTAVLATMSAAVDVVEAAGVPVDRADDRESHLRRAVHWRRYSSGPVNALHRCCAADITRGSLRLLGAPP
jgi:hypothetical protein